MHIKSARIKKKQYKIKFKSKVFTATRLFPEPKAPKVISKERKIVREREYMLHI